MANLKSLFKRLGGYGDNIARNLIEDNAGRAAMSSDLLSDSLLDALESSATHTPVADPNDIYSLFSEPTVFKKPRGLNPNQFTHPKGKRPLPEIGEMFPWSEDML